MRRTYKHKILPHGIPDEIRENPDKWQGQTFAVSVPDDLLTEMGLPLTVCAHVDQLYIEIGRPAVSSTSIWDVFKTLKDRLENDLQDGDRDAVATDFKSLEENFEQDAHLFDVAAPEDGGDDTFFDERLFSDDEQDDIHEDDDEVEFEVELMEDEEDDEVEQLLTQDGT
ncbi:hypothetical protein GGX14DRAFT_402527 [Mycena pura]|uniref:Uncharacterized protein n=1 Tax=Mycena pura TaxID=153505 RepID=A0AAD6UYM2_9AGAR|nr:hypothetical protein GGX14DRAFT_402527 [Mycena pura]